MLSSMTAFARVETDSPWGRISWEIRSVNHRYLDLSFRIPEEFRSLEHGLRDLARKQLDRGKVECSMRLQAPDQSEQAPQLNTTTLDGLRAVEQQLLNVMPNAASLSIKELLAWPGVFSEVDVDSAEQQKVITKLFKQALSSLKENRAREGADLYEVINQRLERMREELVKVSKILPDVLAAQRKRLTDRLQELDTELDPGRIEQEKKMALLNKIDENNRGIMDM